MGFLGAAYLSHMLQDSADGVICGTIRPTKELVLFWRDFAKSLRRAVQNAIINKPYFPKVSIFTHMDQLFQKSVTKKEPTPWKPSNVCKKKK